MSLKTGYVQFWGWKMEKNNVYWWIEESNGKLLESGRRFLFEDFNEVKVSVGCPNLQFTKRQAKRLCRDGEKPVKVRLEKYGKE